VHGSFTFYSSFDDLHVNVRVKATERKKTRAPFAPHAKWRTQVILKPAESESDEANHSEPQQPKNAGPEPSAKTAKAMRERRLCWAELLRRVFAADVQCVYDSDIFENNKIEKQAL
jgi:hypothetical protein